MTQQRIPAAVYRAELAGKTGKKTKTAPKANKYGATKVTRHGITFDSTREADRYDELAMLERGGVITHLQRQVPIPLMGRDGPLKGITGRQLIYRADFTYVDAQTGEKVVEDSKGFKAKEYKLKRSILAAQGIYIYET